MTDNEIIKALECCLDTSPLTCKNCPLFNVKNSTMVCSKMLTKFAIDLINRQQAEIDVLNNNLSAMVATLRNSANATRNEAIKDFAERLKDYLRKQPKWNCQKEKYNNVGFSYDDVFFGIDKIVKEYQERTKESESNEK